MNNHILITILLTSQIDSNMLIARLVNAGLDGFEETGDALLGYVDEAHFNEEDVTAAVDGLGVTYTKSLLPKQNWNALWESNFEPVLVDSFCSIRAWFHPANDTAPYDIEITPKMSFGTGHHATTYLMVKQMQNMDFLGKTVADFGTGTGVLAILAKKLGALNVLAIDNEEYSIENATENVEKNGCNNIDIRLASAFTTEEQFNIILANINRNIIIDNLKAMQDSMTRPGILLLSGLLLSDEQEIVIQCLKLKFSLINRQEKNNWITLQFSLP